MNRPQPFLGSLVEAPFRTPTVPGMAAHNVVGTPKRVPVEKRECRDA